MLMDFVWAFIIGGLICVFGQICFDVFRLSPAHTMTLLVVLGAIAGGLGLYEPFAEFAGAGATIPITSFGNSLVKGALQELKRNGIVGVITGMFEITSAGISAAIIFSFFAAWLCRPKG